MSNDLLKVGPNKPLGYMPLTEIKDRDALDRRLKARGLFVLVLNEMDSRVQGGAMIAYDREALGRLLNSRKDVLIKSRWPYDPDRFVRYHLTHNAPLKTKLYDLVADAYADFSNPYRTDTARISSVITKFGLST